MRIHHIVLILLSLLLQPAYAAENDSPCSQAVFDVLSRFYQKPLFAQADKVVASACKQWPYKPNLTLAAVAFDEAVVDEKTLVVAVLDLGKNKVISNTQKTIAEDAVTLFSKSSLSIDTARWQLSDSARAFGVRFNSSALLGCGARFRDELTLYTPQGQKLNPVFVMPMYVEEALGGCPPTDKDIVKMGNRTIAIAKSKNNSFFDLIATETVTVEGNTDIPANLDTHQKHQYLLKFNGKSYVGPVLDGIFFK